MVRLELWNSARSGRDKTALRDFERVLTELPITDDVWAHAFKLAEKTRSAGATVPGADILVAACAQIHGAELEQADSDFDRIPDH
jgi:predicted nucleic acid-binding protein